MGKIGFNCQLLLSEIGLTTDSSHSTWFHKTARFSRSKSSRFYMKKIWLSMFYSIQVGEEPDSVFLKKQRKQNQVKMIRINPLFLRQRSYHFRRNWSYISFPFPFKSSYVFSRPFETPKNGQIPFLRNTYKMRHYKKDNGNPTINYFIYEFHSNRNTCPTETEFVTCYPLA